LLSHVRISKEIYERNKADPLNLNVMIVMQDLATDINQNAMWKNIPLWYNCFEDIEFFAK